MPNKIKEILIIRPDAIGDLVLTLPAVQAVKAAFPLAKITLLIREYTAPVIENHPAVDRIIFDYNFKPYNFDLSINFFNEWRDTFTIWRAGIPRRLGDSSRILTAWMNNMRVFRNWNDHNLHEVEQNMALLKPLGITSPPEKPIVIPGPLSIPINSEKRLAGVHCGSTTSRAWPPENFAAAVKLLLDNDYQVFLLGNEHEKRSADIINDLNPAPINLAGKLPLADLIALISRLNFYVGMDTGPSHIAAAFNVPMVMIFLNPQARPYRWGPWLTRHLTVAPKGNETTSVLAAIKEVLNGGGVSGLEESRAHWLAIS